MLSMGEIKKRLIKALETLGYTASVSKFTRFSFALRTSAETLDGHIEISSANAKRFEIKIASEDASEFEGHEPRSDDSERMMIYYLVKRFTKNENAIPMALEWISKSMKSLSHLRQLLGYEPPRPSKHFADGTYVEHKNAVFSGFIESAKARALAALDGNKVVEAVYTPGTRPYVLVGVNVRPRTSEISTYAAELTILTDGDVWHPVFNKHVLHTPGVVDRLSQMNQADRALVHMACQSFVSRTYSDEANSDG